MAVAFTPCDLFRVGNASSARLDRIRPRDVAIVKAGADDIVIAGSGGISTLDRPTGLGLSGPWYRLPQGTAYDDSFLILSNPHPGRWEWEPACDMPLTKYQAALADLNQEFVRV
jgi:hypothetical protein